MANTHRERSWADEVRWTRDHGPYEDFGWESGESVLPEFRDSSVHNMPYEFNRIRPWNRPLRSPGRTNTRQNQPPRGRFTGAGPRNYRRSDQRIYEDICDRLSQHGQLDPSQVEVEVKDGEVELHGSVSSRQEKHLVEDIIDSVPGVKDIQDQLRLTGQPAQGRVDRVGHSGVYPASGPNPPEDAEVHTMAGRGQGDRGAAGYEDHGESELPMKEDKPTSAGKDQ